MSGAGLDKLMAPASVAVIGASNDPIRIGGRPIAYMLSQKFEGRILPVNPNRSEVQGLPAFASIRDLPVVPDAAIVAVPGEAALAAMAELQRLGTRAAIVFTAGFAEVGPEGAAAQRAMVEAARAAGMRMLGPNTLGLFNARIGFYPFFSASFEGGFPRPGRIAIASQSGAYGSHLFTIARNRGLGTPVCVTTGNEADVGVGDVIAWLAADPDTDVIAAYVEGIAHRAAFLDGLAAAHRARKPVVLMKVGSSALGAAASHSHTAALVGDDAVFDAVIADYGVVRARSTEELLDIAYAATRRVFPAANSLGVLTISGGAGVLVSDAAEACGLPMPPLPARAQAELKELLPIASPLNPVDCTAQVLNDISLVGRFAEVMMRDGGYASILAFFTQIGGSKALGPQLRRALQPLPAQRADRLHVLSVVAKPEQVAEYETDGFLVFEDPTRAVVALGAMGLLGRRFADKAPDPLPDPPRIALPATSPNEADAKRLLAAAGIATVPEQVCTSAAEAVAAATALGYPVVMKIISPDILHKTEIGGVILDIREPAQVERAYAALLAAAQANAPAARIDGVLVARQLGGAVECIMGVQRDPVFGPVAAFGLGGIFVEVLGDIAIRRCPFGEAAAEATIRSIRGAGLLTGARGRPPIDVPALARMLSRLSVLAHRHADRIASIDLNPVLALPDGAFAADAVLVLDP